MKRTRFARGCIGSSIASSRCGADVPSAATSGCLLNAIILHLNDDHHWTREQIVEWLKKD
jgi:hypothetical protein